MGMSFKSAIPACRIARRAGRRNRRATIPLRAVTAAQMRRLDRLAQKRFGIPELVLMEHAGAAVAREVRRILSRLEGRGGVVLVLAGGGSNGGDGLVAARHLDNAAVAVKVGLLARPERVQGAAGVNLDILRRLKVPVTPIEGIAQWRRWAGRQRKVRLLVDALLGTGVSGQIREPIRSAIAWINQLEVPVVSVDLPSGLSSDSGKPCGVAVRATVTVTCGLPKVGLLKAEGKRLSGRVRVADLSLPRVLL